MHNRWRALAVLASTQFLLILDTAIINVAVPSIGVELRISPAGLSWVANAYLIAFGGLLLLGGRAADHLGKRRVFLTGLGVLIAGSALGAIAGSAPWLVAARGVQGAAAALAAAAAFALILDVFSDGPDRHRALGVFAAMAGAGGAVGTVLGGVLTDWFGWRSTFVLNVVAGAVLVIVSLRFVPEVRHVSTRSGFDVIGAVTVTSGLALLAYGLVSAGESGWLAPQFLMAGGLAAVALLAFVLVERRARAPLVPLSVLRRPTLGTASILSALGQTTLFPMFFFVSIYLQKVVGHSPLGGGLGLLPLSLLVIVVASTADRMIARLGLGMVMVIGFAMAAVGMFWLAAALQADGGFVSDVLGPSLVLAIGVPLIAITTNAAATAQAGPDEAGLASGLINTSQQFGAVLGLAIMAGVVAAHGGSTAEAASRTDPVALTSGVKAAFLVGAAVALVAAVWAARLRYRLDSVTRRPATTPLNPDNSPSPHR